MTLEIAAMQCPAAKRNTISAMKLYIRERVKQAWDTRSEFQNRGVLPLYTNLVRCYDQLVASRETPRMVDHSVNVKEKVLSVPTANPKLVEYTTTIKVDSSNGANTEDVKQPVERQPKKTPAYNDEHKHKANMVNSEPEDTYSIWTAIQKAIENFTRYLTVRHKRSTDEATTSEPKKVENLPTTSSTQGGEQKLSSAQKALKQFSEILLAMVRIASNTCLTEETKDQVKFYEQAMKEVLYWVSSDESLLGPAQEFRIERLVGSMNECRSSKIGDSKAEDTAAQTKIGDTKEKEVAVQTKIDDSNAKEAATQTKIGDSQGKETKIGNSKEKEAAVPTKIGDSKAKEAATQTKN